MVEEFPFPSPHPDGERGYRVFPAALESDPLVVFHGTARVHLASILTHRFRIRGALPSVSFTKTSPVALGYACSKRSDDSPEGVVIAARFSSFAPPGTVEEAGGCVTIYREDAPYEILAYCIVPADYAHR